MKIRGTLRMLHRVGLRSARGSEEKGMENHTKGGGQWEHEAETNGGAKIGNQVECARHI